MTKVIESINVTLTPEQVDRMKAQIVAKANIYKACSYADISTRTFNKALEGGIIKSDQRDSLLAFCDKVEGIEPKSEKAA